MRLKNKRDIIDGIEEHLLNTMSKYMSVDEITAEAERLSEFALNALKEVESTLVAPALSRVKGWNRRNGCSYTQSLAAICKKAYW